MSLFDLVVLKLTNEPLLLVPVIAAALVWLGTTMQVRIALVNSRELLEQLVVPVNELLNEGDRLSEEGKSKSQRKLSRLRKSFRPSAAYKRLRKAADAKQQINEDVSVTREREVANLLDEKEVRALETWDRETTAWATILTASVIAFIGSVAAITDELQISVLLGLGLFGVSGWLFWPSKEEQGQLEAPAKQKKDVTAENGFDAR